jgi:hypothetical protein
MISGLFAITLSIQETTQSFHAPIGFFIVEERETMGHDLTPFGHGGALDAPAGIRAYLAMIFGTVFFCSFLTTNTSNECKQHSNDGQTTYTLMGNPRTHNNINLLS